MQKIALATFTILFSIIFMPLFNNQIEGLTIGATVDTDPILPPPPVPILDARDDTATTNEDTPVRINVLSNDNYIGVGSPRVTSVTTPSHGTAVINADNTIRYTPNKNFFGSDSFAYTISDGTGLLTDTARVSMRVNPVNDAPDARDDIATTNEETAVTINVRLNDVDPDGDSLTVTSVTTPSHGTAVINADNTVTYTPNQNFFGSDAFTYTISDGKGGTDAASIFVTVREVSVFTINQVKSGLVAFDPLNNETKTMQELAATNRTYWTYAGSANTLFNPPAPRDLFKDSEGLHIGVQHPTPAKPSSYAGYYAVTPPTDAKLFHAVITTPVRTISGNFFQNGLYVQTGPQDGRLNYVTCVSVTSTAGTSWHVVRTFGDFNFATDFERLWSDPRPWADQPLTRDCTMITDGNNYLKVYMDGLKVYENRTIDLQMPAPFSYFLEPQNSHTDMLYGIYKDFYIASDENIKVTNAPVTAARVDVVDSSGNVLASAPVTGGTAILDIGKYHFPLAANIKVYDAANIEIASSAASIFGGDVYSIDVT